MQSDVSFRLAGEATPIILVPTFVNGHGAYEFILDTGAYQCILSAELAETLKVPQGAAYEAKGAGGPIRIVNSRIDSLKVGAMERKNISVGVADLQSLSTILSTPILG